MGLFRADGEAVTLQYVVQDTVVVSVAGAPTAAALQRGHGLFYMGSELQRAPLALSKRRRSDTEAGSAVFSQS